MHDVNNTVRSDVDETLNGLLLDTSKEFLKERKYKVGAGVTKCLMQELEYLQELVCNVPCYFGKREIELLEGYIYNLNKR